MKIHYYLNMHAHKKTCGFTLIEVIIVISILAIAMAIAIPSFQNTIQNSYSMSIANQFVNALSYARSEAIMLDTPVSVCAPSDNTFTSCGASWALGWIVFIDVNGNGVYNSGVDTILRTEVLTGQNAVITSSTSSTAATYTNTGFPAASTANVTFTITATGCTGTNANTINISMTGRPLMTNITCP